MKFKKAAQQQLRQLDYKFHRAKLSLRRDGFSNANEDQILARLISELLPQDHDRTAVDIGAGDGIRWSNTYALFLMCTKLLLYQSTASNKSFCVNWWPASSE